jgi:hypothetical protein
MWLTETKILIGMYIKKPYNVTRFLQFSIKNLLLAYERT